MCKNQKLPEMFLVQNLFLYLKFQLLWATPPPPALPPPECENPKENALKMFASLLLITLLFLFPLSSFQAQIRIKYVWRKQTNKWISKYFSGGSGLSSYVRESGWFGNRGKQRGREEATGGSESIRPISCREVCLVYCLHERQQPRNAALSDIRRGSGEVHTHTHTHTATLRSAVVSLSLSLCLELFVTFHPVFVVVVVVLAASCCVALSTNTVYIISCCPMKGILDQEAGLFGMYFCQEAGGLRKETKTKETTTTTTIIRQQ